MEFFFTNFHDSIIETIFEYIVEELAIKVEPLIFAYLLVSILVKAFKKGFNLFKVIRILITLNPNKFQSLIEVNGTIFVIIKPFKGNCCVM